MSNFFPNALNNIFQALRSIRVPLAFKILTPTLIISLLGALTFNIWLHSLIEAKDAEDLQERMRTFLSTQADQLTDPVWTFDQESIDRLFRSYEPNSDLLEVTLYDPDGKIVAQTKGMSAKNYVHTFSGVKTLTRRAGGGTFEVGRLEVVFHDGRIREASATRLMAELKTLLFLLALVVVACTLLVHYAIGIPLARLKKSLDLDAETGTHVPLAWSTNDEIGDVVTSYNAMLQENENKTKNLNLAAKVIENAFEGVIITDREGTIEQVNPSFTAITGYTAAEAVGQNPRFLNSGRHTPEFFRELWRMIKTEGVWAGEIWNRRKSGEIYPEWMTISAIADTSGYIDHYVSVFHDITESKEAEEHLRKAKETAEAANKVKTEFLANMSHEIRTPLNGILGMLQLLETTSPNSEQEEYISTAIKTTNRLSRLLTDILDLSKIESNKLAIYETPFCVNDLKQSVQELFETAATNKGLSFEFLIDDDIPDELVGDEARVRQVLFNLVGNAIKFTEHGGVTVKITRVPTTDQSLVQVKFSILDTGIGIPKQRQRDIFEPFTQVDRSYIRRHQGAGLGLAIVRRLVDLLGGTLTIESEEGLGTEISVLFPFAAAPAALSWSSEKTTGIAGDLPDRAIRVLLVEDEAINRITMTRMLEKAGYAITTANDGLDAIHKIAAQQFDIILMDIQMPVMDGIEATRMIRSSADGLGSRVPIIALTAYAMSGDRERFLEGGMDDYVAKPVEIGVLKQVIAKALRRASATSKLLEEKHE